MSTEGKKVGKVPAKKIEVAFRVVTPQGSRWKWKVLREDKLEAFLASVEALEYRYRDAD